MEACQFQLRWQVASLLEAYYRSSLVVHYKSATMQAAGVVADVGLLARLELLPGSLLDLQI